jgi:hypothetical protein
MSAVLLIAIFPGNIRAAQEHLKIGDTPATPLPLRALLRCGWFAIDDDIA